MKSEYAEDLGIKTGTTSWNDLIASDAVLYDVRILKNGEPCDHIGCRNHISHPCEGCGRISCKGTAEIRKDKHVI